MLLAAFGVVVALMATSLAVDTGRIGTEKRNNQKVADLAALDAVREVNLGQALQRGRESALRNGFDYSDPNHELLVERGTVDSSNTFTPDSSGSAVRVTATTLSLEHDFMPGERTVSAQAIAVQQTIGGFSIGSSLATINTADAGVRALMDPFLDSTIGQMIGWPTIDVALVGWQGLASGSVTLEALQTELANMGFSVGTVSQLLGANLTIAQFFEATASALNLQGDVANFTVMDYLSDSATNAQTFTLGDLIKVEQGGNDAALASQLNVYQLVMGSAQVVNGSNFVSIPSLTVTIPGVTSSELGLTVIEPVQWYFGPIGGSVDTGQVNLTVTTDLDLPISVLGLVNARVHGDFPVQVGAAGAVGTLAGATCAGASPGITVYADPILFSSAASSTLTVSADVNLLLGTVTLDVLELDMDTLAASDAPGADLVFSWPSEFPPPDGTQTTKRVGSEPIGLAAMSSFTASNVTVLNAVALGLGTSIVNSVVAGLTDVTADVDLDVLTPLLDLLGVDVGVADVTAHTLDCESPTLVG